MVEIVSNKKSVTDYKRKTIIKKRRWESELASNNIIINMFTINTISALYNYCYCI